MLPLVPYKIILPNGQDKTVVRRRRAILPSNGDVHLRCNRCGSTDFTIHGAPNEKTGALRITVAACSLCGGSVRFNDRGEIGGVLKIDSLNVKEREAINERPDN